MQISSIRIKNFRALKDVEIPLARSTVIIGENNSAKSSVLDCISLALGRRWGQRGTGFSDYDLTITDEVPAQSSEADEDVTTGAAPDVAEEGDSGQPSDQEEAEPEEPPPEASIELYFEEQTPGEWPDEITSGLFGITQPDPFDGRNSITLRVSYRFNPLEKNYEPGWAFIDINGDPIGSREAKRAANTQDRVLMTALRTGRLPTDCVPTSRFGHEEQGTGYDKIRHGLTSCQMFLLAFGR